MSASDPSIQPVKGASDSAKPTTVFAGTVTSVSEEDDGKQTVEIASTQGRVRVQAEGEFKPGDKVRVAYGNNGTVQVAKGGLASGADAEELSYTLPENLGALRDLQAFEEDVVQWMGQRQNKGASGTQDKSAMLQMSLPQLMQQVMGEEGGAEFLGQSLASLDPQLTSALMDAISTDGGGAADNAPLIDMLKSALQGNAPASGNMQGTGNAQSTGNAGGTGAGKASGASAYLTGEAGAGASPWFGRIVDKQEADNFMTPLQRLQFGGPGAQPPPGSGKADPMFRYVMDMGGRTMEVYSSESKQPGELADFGLERHGARLEARFSDPAASLPDAAKAALTQATPETRQGMLLAAHYLEDFKDEPYYGDLVKDFGEVLGQSGLMQKPADSGAAAPPLPDQKEMDGLLKLFVSFPRDTQQPEKQARAWGEAVRDPQALQNLLKNVRPDQDASLLRSGTSLRLAAQGETVAAAETLMAAAAKEGETPEATAAWLKKLLPEAFKSQDLIDLAGNAAQSPAAKDHDPAKFLLQAVTNGLPREEQTIPQGQPTQFYYYQGQEWRNLQVTWEKGDSKQGRGKDGPKAPLQVRVETQARHMGKVNVAVSWDPKGAKIDFKNQHVDVRDLLSKSLPELEKSLSMLDFRISSWTYEVIPDDASAPDPGWTRPASLMDGTKMDLFG